MAEFDAAYKKLNTQQKTAVDAIDGPVMVIAGPGTGKTQLLSMRVANILKQTDTQASNILCLTFTESAATEMKDRLVGLIGQDGYGVNIATFHSFGTEIISRFPEYFYNGAHMQPIDDISSYEILHDIFDGLPHSNPLSTKFYDEFTYLKDTQNVIGQLKKAAVTPESLKDLIKLNEDFLKQAEPIITYVFADRISKKQINAYQKALNKLEATTSKEHDQFQSIKQVLVSSLGAALESGETPPISQWKKDWLKKDATGQLVIKDRANTSKLKALASVYQKYQESLNTNRLFDYDDMVLEVVEKLKTNHELRAEVQEQYLYVLVDEFQDTNDAQLQLLKYLADNPVNEGRPNIMVVGDDDQAIYKFQGADITNMHQFASWVRSPEVVALTDIYRYSQPLLDVSSYVIEQSSVRLTDEIEGTTKDLKAVPTHPFTVERLQYETDSAELFEISATIAKLIKSGVDPSDIAVIARQHSQLEEFSLYAQENKVPINYDRKDNVLDQRQIKQLIHFAKTVVAIAKEDRRTVNGYMPELLSYDFWGINPVDLWRLNRSIDRSNDTWLDAMLEHKAFKPVAELLLELGQSANKDPLTYTLDLMIGAKSEMAYPSPFYSYYFSTEKMGESGYIALISNLKTLHQKLREHSTRNDDKLIDLLDFIELQNASNTKIVSTSHISTAESSVSLLTAHKSKGLEFDYVFIIRTNDSTWGATNRRRSSLIKLPANMPITPAGDNQDDRIRLFYVAMTRAKKQLTLSSSTFIGDKQTLPLRLLESSEDTPAPNTLGINEKASSAHDIAASDIISWEQRHFEAAQDNHSIIKNYIEGYRLSISHLQNYVDVSSDGPNNWLLYNLLKFPGPVIPPAAYGSAIHATLNEAQKYLANEGSHKKISDLLNDYKISLKRMGLSESDYNFYLNKGESSLQLYLKEYYNAYSNVDKSEVSFYSDNIIISSALTTGFADKLRLTSGSWEKGSVEIIDYKTGKPSNSWSGKSPYEKIKLYRYKQQLIFYKLLFEKSPQFSAMKLEGLSLEFVDPDDSGTFHKLSLDVQEDDIKRLELLVGAVWKSIQTMSFPSTLEYEDTLDDLMRFEDFLIESSE